MHFAGALELLGLPYTGAPPLALGLCRDKVKTKLILRGHGIPTAPFVLAEDAGRPPREPALPRDRQAGRRGRQPRDHRRERGRGRGRRAAGDRGGARRATAPCSSRSSSRAASSTSRSSATHPPRVLPVSEIDFCGLAPGAAAHLRLRGQVGAGRRPLRRDRRRLPRANSATSSRTASSTGRRSRSARSACATTPASTGGSRRRAA